jgi:hypothetical protein
MAKRIEVNGLAFDVDEKKLGGWHVFQLLKNVRAIDDDYEKVTLLLEIVCYITDTSEAEFIGKCGGEDAPLVDVVQTAVSLIQEAYPKN